jgi:hypothetical protein
VSAHISNACRKRQYPEHFSSKLNVADAENSETLTGLLFAFKRQLCSSKTI